MVNGIITTDDGDLTKLNILLDTGSSKTLVKRNVIDTAYFEKHKTLSTTHWRTNAGLFTTQNKLPITFSMPTFAPRKEITWIAQVDESIKSFHGFDLIIGRDLLNILGMDIKFSTKTLVWDDIAIPMQSYPLPNTETTPLEPTPNNFDYNIELAHIAQESESLYYATTDDGTILESNYQKADIDASVKSWDYPSPEQQTRLKTLLYTYESLFDGTLGTWNIDPVDLELKPGAKPYHARPYPIPQIHKEVTLNEIQRLESVGVLKRCLEGSQWATPTFIVPKKEGTVRIVTDFRVLNNLVIRHPFPMPKTQEMLQDIQHFTYATAIDLIMGFYNVRLTQAASRLCTTVLPWGTYQYLRLPMGVTNSPDIFQARMADLFHDVPYVRIYIDDLLILTNGPYEDHLEKLQVVLERLQKAGLKINLPKCHIAKQEVEYLGYWLTPTGIKPQAKKVEAIIKLASPKTVKQLRQFLGMVNFYRDMWHRRSHLLAPLSDLLGGGSKHKTKKITWTSVHKKAFQDIKKVLSEEVMLAFPNFNKPFDIHTDSSDYQLGAVISQDGKPLAFYSRKLTATQK